MATSGSVTYSITEADLVKDVLEDLGVLEAGGTVASADTTKVRRKLNFLLKNISSASDYFSGEKFWLRKVGYLFLQTNQSQYSLGPSGDHATSSFVRTTLAASASSGASTISVSSATGISNTYNIAVQLDSGALQWTTVNGVPVGTTITLTATLTGNATAGNTVYCYQTKMRRPLKILTANLRDSTNNDVPVGIVTLDDFEEVGNKYSDADPLAAYFSPTLTNATLTFTSEPNDVTKVLRMWFRSPIEDMTATTDDFDIPQEFYRYLSAQLYIDCAPSYGVEVGPTIKLIRDEALAICRNAQPQELNLYFHPGMYRNNRFPFSVR